MAGSWPVTARETAASASATQNSPAGAANVGMILRVRAVQAAIGGATAATSTFTISDSVLGTIFQMDINNGEAVQLANCDIRSGVGGNLTFTFTPALAVANDVNAQGDFVSVGY